MSGSSGPRVAVVGSANVDTVVTVDRHPGAGETVLGGDARRTPGGKGANQAVAAARAGGADVALVAAVGSDDGGDLLLGSLAAAGVDVTAVRRVPGPTGAALIAVTRAGENAIVVAPCANARLRVDDVAERVVRGADVVLAQLEVPLDVVAAAAGARRPGTPLVLNAAPSQPLPDALWQQVDVLVVNEHEAADLAAAGEDRVDPRVLAARLLGRVPAVVVTLGAAGALVARRGRDVVAVRGAAVHVVDTTGAGDTFCGVLAAELARGADLVAAVRPAVVAGSLAVTRQGAQESVPGRGELAAALEA